MLCHLNEMIDFMLLCQRWKLPFAPDVLSLASLVTLINLVLADVLFVSLISDHEPVF